MSAKRNFKSRSDSRNTADTQVIRGTSAFQETVEQVKEQLKVPHEEDTKEVLAVENPNEATDIEKALVAIAGVPGAYGKIERSKLTAAPESWNYFDQLSTNKKALMVESIYNNGLLQPVIVRAIDPENTVFQILAGHNRNFCYEVLKEITGESIYDSIDAKIYWFDQLNDEQAKTIVEDTNYIQRGSLSIKDRTKYICNKVRTIKRQSFKDGGNGDIMSLIADQLNINRTTVYHWKKIENLIPELTALLENKAITLVTAAKIAGYPLSIQRKLYEQLGLVTNESIKTLKPKMYQEDIIPTLKKFFAEKSPEIRGKVLSEIPNNDGHFVITIDKAPQEDEVPVIMYLPKDRVKTLLTRVKEYVISQ